MQTDLSAAKDLLEQAQERQARYANTKRADAEFAVGDQVLLPTASTGHFYHHCSHHG